MITTRAANEDERRANCMRICDELASSGTRPRGRDTQGSRKSGFPEPEAEPESEPQNVLVSDGEAFHKMTHSLSTVRHT